MMNDLNNPAYRLGAARGRLDYCYIRWICLLDYASTAPTSIEEKRNLRKALKWKAKGIVEHDRLLNGIGLK